MDIKPHLAHGYYFRVKFPSSVTAETSFSEVKGLDVTVSTDEIEEGGVNNYVHKIPTGVKYGDLVLTRGFMSKHSKLTKWVLKQMENIFEQKINPKLLLVELLNKKDGKTLMSWEVKDAFPISWSIAGFNAQNSELLIEEIKFSYSHFTLKLQ